MTTLYGGDEVNALVLDIGTCLCKAGYAGDDAPKGIFPSSVGVLEGSEANGTEASARGGDKATTSKCQLYVGNSALQFRRDGMEIESPFSEAGLYRDWEAIEALCAHAFTDRLRANVNEYALLLAEPSHNSREAREKTVELMFEKFGVPALFLARNAVLSSFATARQTSLVLDAGYATTTAAAVHDGYLLGKTVVHSPVAGRTMNQAMQAAIEGGVGDLRIRPRYAFKMVEKKDSGQLEAVNTPFPKTTASYRDWAVEAIAADVKESLCRVHENTTEGMNVPTVAYELPDGHEIHVGAARFKVPETLFQPQLLTSFPGLPERLAKRGLDPSKAVGIADLAMEAINRCDVDVRKDMYGGVVLTGGSSLFTGLRDRLDRELQEHAPQAAKIKVVSPANSIERRFSAWIGGSILASLGSFQQLWMSKKEFEEHGASLMHRKSP